jgi:phenol/toluene 2-monooxygenase (NADH) P0/A0
LLAGGAERSFYFFDIVAWHMSDEPHKGLPPGLRGKRGAEDQSDLTAELARKYVCIRDVSPQGNVRFDFAIGWPELSVELVLPKAAFDEFCRHNEVREMPPPDGGLQSINSGDEE